MRGAHGVVAFSSQLGLRAALSAAPGRRQCACRGVVAGRKRNPSKALPASGAAPKREAAVRPAPEEYVAYSKLPRSVAKHVHVLRTFCPTCRQRIKDDDVQQDRGQRPERVCAIPGEAELGEDVQGHDKDREPACPRLCA